jgi:hypothetical protein
MALTIPDAKLYADLLGESAEPFQLQASDRQTVKQCLSAFAIIQQRVFDGGAGPITTIDQLVTRIRQGYPDVADAFDAAKAAQNP